MNFLQVCSGWLFPQQCINGPSQVAFLINCLYFPPPPPQPASLLRIPILPAASPSNSSYGSLAAPWSLMATVNHLALSCSGAVSAVASTPANATLAPSTLPSALLTVFRSGLRNLTMQVRGGLRV